MSTRAMNGLKGLAQDYTRSLKAIEMEEALDLVLYRPLAFVLAKLAHPTPITPNQISIASLGFGLLSGWFFAAGTPEAGIAAAAAYFLCNTLDCADGQLARLRGKPSPFGYIVDGSIDYVASIAVFVGIAHNLTVQKPGQHNWWLLATVAGLCYAWQCAIVDRKRMEWDHKVYGKRRDSAATERFFAAHLELYRQQGSHLLERGMIRGYLFYSRLCTRLISRQKEETAESSSSAQAWAAYNRPVLRMALWMGPSTQMTLIMFAGVFNRLDLYLWGVLLFGNLHALLVLLVQRHQSDKIARVVATR
jgi:phosphatidylglycerophosphate synthase